MPAPRNWHTYRLGARLAAVDEVFLMLAALCALAMLAARHLGAPGGIASAR